MIQFGKIKNTAVLSRTQRETCRPRWLLKILAFIAQEKRQIGSGGRLTGVCHFALAGVPRNWTDGLMLKRDEQFHLLMRQAMTGSASAAQELFEKYDAVLLRAIRRKLSHKVRSKFDSLDFVQYVWASFFAEPAQQRVFESPEHLVRFLTKLARNKVVDA